MREAAHRKQSLANYSTFRQLVRVEGWREKREKKTFHISSKTADSGSCHSSQGQSGLGNENMWAGNLVVMKRLKKHLILKLNYSSKKCPSENTNVCMHIFSLKRKDLNDVFQCKSCTDNIMQLICHKITWEWWAEDAQMISPLMAGLTMIMGFSSGSAAVCIQ